MDLHPNNEDAAIRFRITGAMLKLGRNEFCRKHGFNRYTIQSWEMGRNQISPVLLHRFCEALSAEGIFCSPEWLLKGKGSAPVKLASRDDLPLDAAGLNPEENKQFIQSEMELFRKNQILANRDPIILEVADQAMKPFFSKGDLVGGYVTPERSIGTLLGQIVIASISPGNFVVRRLMRDVSGYMLIPSDYSQRAVSIKKLEKVAKIIWHRVLL